MPCDSIRRTSIEFGKNTDTALLAEALRAMGMTVTHVDKNIVNGNGFNFNRETGVLNAALRYRTINEDELKQNYAKQVVLTQAAKFGFKVAEEGRKEVRHVRV